MVAVPGCSRVVPLVDQIPPDAFEGGMAQKNLARLRAIFRVDHHARLDPSGFGKFPRRVDRLLLGSAKLAAAVVAPLVRRKAKGKPIEPPKEKG